MYEFCLLGPLEVRSNGHTLDLGGQKQRVLLAMLLLEANRVVSSDRLIEAIWEEQPTPTPGKVSKFSSRRCGSSSARSGCRAGRRDTC